MGMAEQLLMGAAAGMAHEGAQPFVTTYAVFASRRAYDFIHQTIAEENLNVKIVCALPGLTSGYGPSHQAAEDLALFRAMPNMTVIDPCDALETEQVVPAIAAHKGPVYMRLLARQRARSCSTSTTTSSSSARRRLLRDGADVLIISSGIMTMRALEVAKALEADKVGVGVLHVPTIKPLDTETILREAERTGRMVVVAENHTVIGGLGEAVAATLLTAGVTPKFRQIALPDEFLPRARCRPCTTATASRPRPWPRPSRAGWGKAAANTIGIGRQSVTQGRFGHDDGRFHRSRSHGPAHGEEPRGARLHRPRLRHEASRHRCSGRGGRRAGSLRRRGRHAGPTSWC